MPVTQADLTVPNSEEGLRLVRAFVRELTDMAGLEGDEATDLLAAAEEACANVFVRSFAAGEMGMMAMEGRLDASNLTLVFHDRGVPFVPVEEVDELEEANEAGPVLDWSLVHRAVDEAHWTNLGKEGMELRLVKRTRQLHIADAEHGVDLTPFHDEMPLAPAQSYDVRRMLPDEAIGVSQCIYQAYGYTYPNDDLYYPDRVRHLNETEALVSIVAVAEDGRVVGHYALESPRAGGIAERGQAVVNPAHRGRHLLDRMRAVLEEESRRLALRGVFSQAVTTHTLSQKVNESYGAHVCAATLGLGPRNLTFKRFTDELLPQRLSCMYYHQYVQPPRPSPVYAPAHHRELIARIYEHLESPVEFREPPHASWDAYFASIERAAWRHQRPVSVFGQVETSFVRAFGAGFIRVRTVGCDTLTEVRRASYDLCMESGAEVVYLDLPLAQPPTALLCAEAEQEGFVFSGICPDAAEDGDVLRLQYLTTPLDLSLLQVESPFGQQLLAYIDQQRPMPV